MNNKKNIVIGFAFVLSIALIAAAVLIFKSKTTINTELANVAVVVPTEDAFDVVMKFYNDWLGDTQSTTTDPFVSGLINSPRLSDQMRSLIKEKNNTKVGGDLDSVFCQTAIPERIGGKEIFKDNTSAQVIIFARGLEAKSPYQAVVTLSVVEGQWQIGKIECIQGDVAPLREYDFERSGFLLKSVPAPYNPEYWHLVYEENEKPGHVLPLFFDAESICVAKNGVEATCDPSQFVEPAKVLLQADMLDNGADVRKVTFE